MFFLLATAALVASACFGQGAAHPKKADLPAQDELRFESLTEDSNGELRFLHHSAKIETSEMLITGDEIEYNSDTHWAKAYGHVHMEHFVSGDIIDADRGEYNLKTEEGKFYGVHGTAPAKIVTSPGVLTTTNPFYFQAIWAQRIRDRYILHHGFLTDCTVPKPWWRFQAPLFDVIPGDRAIARNAIFLLHGVPIFYLPFFYRPLGKNPRQSGFLTPVVGHSSIYGYIYGAGYYWAINRSYDMTGYVEDYTLRGPVERFDFRGKPTEKTDFNFYSYSVQDQNGDPTTKQKQGGLEFELTARAEVLGFTGVLDYNYLSSLLFREAFSPAFGAAVISENNSVGFLQRHFKDERYTANIVFQRGEFFEAVTPLNQRANEVILQKLPSVEFNGRDHELTKGPVPVWFSFGTSAGLLNRQEPTGANTVTTPVPTHIFSSGEVARLDAEPRVATQFSFKGFSLNPSLTFGATEYSDSYGINSTTYTPRSGIFQCSGYPTCTADSSTTATLSGSSLFRKHADAVVNLKLPSVERVFQTPKWLRIGGKLKHVVEAEATYEYVTGVDEFQKIIHFDATDIFSNTNQLTLSLTNRLYRKDKNGNVNQILSWRVSQARYFDPTFGGVVTPNQGVCATGGVGVQDLQNPICQRVIVYATEQQTPIPFLDGPRTYSPVSSALTLSPSALFSIDWRADYDPARRKFVDQSVGLQVRKSKVFGSLSDTSINTNPLLIPAANQIGLSGGYGNSNRKGFNAAASVFYDTLLGRRLFDFVQASYNTNCCGFSVELRNFNLGIRDENQYLFSFSVANIGTFGSLPKQNRLF